MSSFFTEPSRNLTSTSDDDASLVIELRQEVEKLRGDLAKQRLQFESDIRELKMAHKHREENLSTTVTEIKREIVVVKELTEQTAVTRQFTVAQYNILAGCMDATAPTLHARTHARNARAAAHLRLLALAPQTSATTDSRGFCTASSALRNGASES
jgi:hypothetical protein